MTSCQRCQLIREILKPTMALAKPDSVAVLIPAAVLHRIYKIASSALKPVKT